MGNLDVLVEAVGTEEVEKYMKDMVVAVDAENTEKEVH